MTEEQFKTCKGCWNIKYCDRCDLCYDCGNTDLIELWKNDGVPEWRIDELKVLRKQTIIDSRGNTVIGRKWVGEHGHFNPPLV